MGLTAGLDLNACITSLSFSSTGSLLLAGSRNCPRVLLYETESGVLVGSFLLTTNRLLEGISRELNSKFIADDGKQELWPQLGFHGMLRSIHFCCLGMITASADILSISRSSRIAFVVEVGNRSFCCVQLFFLSTDNQRAARIFQCKPKLWGCGAGTAIQEYELSDVDDDLNEGERERKRIRNVRI